MSNNYENNVKNEKTRTKKIDKKAVSQPLKHKLIIAKIKYLQLHFFQRQMGNSISVTMWQENKKNANWTTAIVY